MTTTNAWHLDGWGRWMKAAGRPETTIGLRLYHLHRVATDLDHSPLDVSVDDLADWLAGHQWAPHTRRSYRASLRGYYGWLQATGRRVDSPAHLLPPVTVPRGRPRPTPEPMYRAALGGAGAREGRMVALAGMCGLRRGEIARVRREDAEADLVGRSLRVVGKGGHVRLVPLPDWLAADLSAQPPGWLFPSTHGGHLTAHHVGRLVSALLPEGWACHTLRHRCATVSYQATMDIASVQELLGHAKVDTTRLYVLAPDGGVRAAMCAAAA